MIFDETTQGYAGMSPREQSQWEEITGLKKRMAEAVTMLYDLIDGGEERRGYDSAISSVIRKLEGNT